MVSVWSEEQICISPSWCHCHSLTLAPVNSDWFYQNGSAFLVPAFQGCPGKRPLNECNSISSIFPLEHGHTDIDRHGTHTKLPTHMISLSKLGYRQRGQWQLSGTKAEALLHFQSRTSQHFLACIARTMLDMSYCYSCSYIAWSVCMLVTTVSLQKWLN